MADLEHITVNGETYDISDATARENADSAANTATNAATAATNAQNAADKAQSTADSAATAASTAQSTADSASSAAGAAQSSADANKSSIEDLQNTIDDLFPDSAGGHNGIYRGKYLGTEVTDEQYAAIKAGTFEDLYIGDYWTIGGVNWRIAGFDYYIRTGSNYSFADHHIVIVPDTRLYTATMNDSNTTEGGYVGSLMFTENLEDAKATVKAAFGEEHIATHEVYLTNAVTDGRPSAGAWTEIDVDLMNEEMVYGCPIKQQMSYGGINVYTYTVEKSQLPLFRLQPYYQNIRATYWLRDIVSATDFCDCVNGGNAGSGSASGSYGVRPAFCIYQS